MTFKEFFETARELVPAGKSFNAQFDIWEHRRANGTVTHEVRWGVWEGSRWHQGNAPEVVLEMLEAAQRGARLVEAMESMAELPERPDAPAA